MSRSTDHIPANLPRFPDLLARCSPIVLTEDDGDTLSLTAGRTGIVSMASAHACFVRWDAGGLDDCDYLSRYLALVLTERAGRAQLGRVMTVGLRCDNACTNGHAEPGVECGRCGRTGYLRPPAPVRHLLPAAEMGDLPPVFAASSAALLSCSAWRMSVGLGVVRGILPPWEDVGGGACYRSASDYEWATRADVTGWAYAASFDHHVTGREEGAAGRALADAAALADGLALAGPSGALVLPWPP